MFNSFFTPTGFNPPITNLAVGDFYQGGTVVYLLQSGDPGYDPIIQHGFIFGEFIDNPNPGAGGPRWPWGSPPQQNVSTGSAIGTGATNTAAILAAYAPNTDLQYGAYAVHNSTYNGYTDWFIPSLYELKAIIPFAKTLGPWTANTTYAWTSTQTGTSTAWCIYNNQLNEEDFLKIGYYLIPLVRSF